MSTNNYTESGERVDYRIPLPDTLYTAMMTLYGIDPERVIDGKWSQHTHFLPLFTVDSSTIATQKLRELGIDTRTGDTVFDCETNEVVRMFLVNDHKILDQLEKEALRRKTRLPEGFTLFHAIVTLRSRPL